MYIEKETEFVKDFDLKEHSILRGFYQSSITPEIYLSKEGRVWSEVRETFIKVKPSKYGYPCFNSLKETYLLHVLLAELFIVKPKSTKPLEVNHKDGNKNNYTLSNLEWVTRRENVLHALQKGLISNTRYILLSKDFVTGEIVEHSSLNECARYIQCYPATLSYYLRRIPNSLLKGRYDVIYKGGRWNVFSIHDVGRPSLGSPRAIIAHHLKSNTMTIYRSANDAATHTEVNRSEISARASGKRSSIVKGYCFIWLDEYKGCIDGIPVVDEKVPEKRISSKNFVKKEKPIRVTYSSGRVETFSGCSVLAELLKVSKETLQRSIRNHQGKYHDMQVTYL